MSLGDGTTWDETLPTDLTLATLIDDHIRDLRKGARLRLSNEHEWPASQGSITVAGMHKFITVQNQTVKPILSGTQVGAIYTKVTGTTTEQELFWENENGDEVQLTDRAYIDVPVGSIIQIVSTQYGAPITCTTTMPFQYSNIIPTNTNGDEVMSLSITPRSSSSGLLVRVGVNGGSTNVGATAALYKDTATNAVAAIGVGTYGITVHSNFLEYYTTAGTTGAITFKVRCGGESTAFFFNANNSGLPILGGIPQSSITIFEIKA